MGQYLSVSSSTSNNVYWRLEGLDINYSRNDRLINLTLLDKNNKILTNLAQEFDQGVPWNYEDILFHLPSYLPSINNAWRLGITLKEGENYKLQSQIFYSYGTIDITWRNNDIFTQAQVKKFFPCYPYYNLGNGHGCTVGNDDKINNSSVEECYKKILTENEINILYNTYKNDLTEFSKQWILSQVNAQKTALKHNIVQWFGFPSISYIINQRGNFTWAKWITQSKFTNQIKKNTETFVYHKTNLEKEDSLSYDDNFLYPENNVTVTGSVTSQYKALFPPIIESYQPAFIGEKNNSYEIFFKLSNYTNIEEVAHVDLRITQQADNANVVNTNIWEDKIIYKPKKDIINYENGLYSVKITANALDKDDKRDLKIGHWEKDTYYKVQLRLGTEWLGWKNQKEYLAWRDEQINKGQFSEWSTVMILKSISTPEVKILNNGNLNLNKANIHTVELTQTPEITGIYNFEGNELLNQYKFILYDNSGSIIEDSGWIQYNTMKIFGETDSSVAIKHQFKTRLKENEFYQVIFYIETLNYFSAQSQPYQFKVLPTDSSIFNFPQEGIELIAENDDENGLIKLFLQNNKDNDIYIKGNLILSRKEYYSDFEEILTYLTYSELKLIKGNLQSIYTDFTPANGVKYNYYLAEVNSLGQKGKGLEVSGETNFEHYFIYAKGRQLKIKYNPQIESFKYTVLAAKQDTLGGKYPTILRNGMAHYAEFPIGGLLSLHAEEEGDYFYKIAEKDLLEDKYYDTKKLYLHGRVEKYNENKELLIKSINHIKNSDEKGFKTETELTKLKTFNTNLTADNFFLEKKYRDAAEAFLNDGDYKMFRSPTEGNFIIGIINVQLKPNQQLGRLISNFSANAYEIADFTLDNLKELSILPYKQELDITYGTKKIFGQIAGLYSKDENLLEIIDKKITQENNLDYSLNYLSNFSIEPFPKNINIQAINLYNAANNNKEQIDYMETLYKTLNSTNGYQPIKFEIINTNQKRDFVALPNKVYQVSQEKLYYNPDRKDKFIITNNVPLILNYIADARISSQKENIVNYSFSYSGYDQLNGYFIDSNKDISNSSLLNLTYRYNPIDNTYIHYSYENKHYYGSLNLLVLITSQIITKLGMELKEDFSYYYDKNKGNVLYYEDENYEIKITNIHTLTIEADENTAIKVGENEILMNSSEKYQLEDVENINHDNFIGFIMDTAGTINYSYTLTAIKKGVRE